MLRRQLLKQVAALPFIAGLPTIAFAVSNGLGARVRPSDSAWPSPRDWAMLRRAVGGDLVKPETVWATCEAKPGTPECLASVAHVRNPFWLGDQPGGTQVSGWLNAWTPKASAYAVAARTAGDVVAAVNFARKHNLRLVVKGGGHSYLGGSNAPDSLLIWTRAMNRIELHDAFVPEGCSSTPTTAVALEAGCMWIDAYDAVTTKAGRYVQGGGCATVGVPGLVQGGGFGSFSKRFGLAAASLLQAEIVTADGQLRTVNACREPDLFWALQGGGGGSFGVVTKMILKTHDLPSRFGYVGTAIKAASDDAFQRLLARFLDFYADSLFNPTWGDGVNVRPDNVLEIGMVCHDLDDAQAAAVWRPVFDSVRAAPHDFVFTEDIAVGTGDAKIWWDAQERRRTGKGANAMIFDDRPGAPSAHAWWRGDQDQVSAFLHGYDSQWLPASLLASTERGRLAKALYAASRFEIVRLHFNKGLAGASPEQNALARRCAINPSVADAFALAIVATGGPPPFPGLPGPKPDMAKARRNAENIAKASAELKRVAPDAGSYISETSFFRTDWREAFWGGNYARLKAIKDHYDPNGFFFVHHGVGSEDWSPDGFARLART